jgi:VanZ family protein
VQFGISLASCKIEHNFLDRDTSTELQPMSASPLLFDRGPIEQPANLKNVRLGWLPVLGALVFICFTSTNFMGGTHTQIVLNAVWKTFLGSWHWDLTGPVNVYGRKVGHFIGYGLVSLIFGNAWYKSAQAFAWVTSGWLTPFASSLAVASTFTVACLDEFHQTFLATRVGSLHDALLDTAGAICLNVLFWSIRARNRRKLLERQQVESAVAAR